MLSCWSSMKDSIAKRFHTTARVPSYLQLVKNLHQQFAVARWQATPFGENDLPLRARDVVHVHLDNETAHHQTVDGKRSVSCHDHLYLVVWTVRPTVNSSTTYDTTREPVTEPSSTPYKYTR